MCVYFYGKGGKKKVKIVEISPNSHACAKMYYYEVCTVGILGNYLQQI